MPLFEIFDLQLYSDLETRVRGSLKVIGTDTYRSATYDFLLTFHSNHGPIVPFSVESRKIFAPRVLCVPADGVPLEMGIGAH